MYWETNVFRPLSIIRLKTGRNIQWNSWMRSKSLRASSLWSLLAAGRRVNNGGGLMTWTRAAMMPTRPAPHSTESIISRGYSDDWDSATFSSDCKSSTMSLARDGVTVSSSVSSKNTFIIIIFIIVSDELLKSHLSCYHTTQWKTFVSIATQFITSNLDLIFSERELRFT